MPKKTPSYRQAKPTSSVHPSLSSSFSSTFKDKHAPRSLHSPPAPSGNSVHDLIQRQRLHHPSSRSGTTTPATSSANPSEQRNCPTLHPSLNGILDIPDTPAPRPRHLVSIRSGAGNGRRARGPAGPPPPTSWLKRSDDQSHVAATIRNPNLGDVLVDPYPLLDTLPDTNVPGDRTLAYHTLKVLARNWSGFSDEDKRCLAALPTRLKATLLSFVAGYGSPEGVVGRADLEILFRRDAESESDSGWEVESLTHLDLSRSIGDGLSLPELVDFLAPGRGEDARLVESRPVPESWDAPPLPLQPPRLRLPNLTHLSLSAPGRVSWKALLRVSPHLATLTHLSLAYWPSPSVYSPPNRASTKTTSTDRLSSRTATATATYSSSVLLQRDQAHAPDVLRRLSRDTYCLRWLDLTGCSEWIADLWHPQGPDWTGSWRGLTTVKADQGCIPDCFSETNQPRFRQRVTEACKRGPTDEEWLEWSAARDWNASRHSKEH